VTYTGAWGSLALYNRIPLNTKGYKALRFRVHGGTSGTRKLQVRFNNNSAYNTFVDTYANQWTQVDILLADMGNPSSLTYLFIQAATDVAPQPTFYVDQIELVP